MKGFTVVIAVIILPLIQQTFSTPCKATSISANSQRNLKNCYKKMQIRASVLKGTARSAVLSLAQTLNVDITRDCLNIISIQSIVQRGMNITKTNNLTDSKKLHFHRTVLNKYNIDLQLSVLKVLKVHFKTSLLHIKPVLRDVQAIRNMIDLALLNMHQSNCQTTKTNIQIPTVTNANSALVCRTVDLHAFALIITGEYYRLYHAA